MLSRSTDPLRIGFVPLTDCAPLIVAREFGLFEKYDLKVKLSRELGWATIRDKVVYGELQAAHAVAGMLFAATLGLGSIPCETLTGLVLNLHGNAITLSSALCRDGIQDAHTLKHEILRRRHDKTFTFGVVYPYSSHNFLLRQWLATAGIHPERDVRIVVVPPPQMFANLKAGNLDGYCVGEPWNTVAVQAGIGQIVATSAELAPGHPEKVLMVRNDFARDFPDLHGRLIRAVLEACRICDDPAHFDAITRLLARKDCLNVSPDCVRQKFADRENIPASSQPSHPNFAFNQFSMNNANDPSLDKAAWVLNQMFRCGLLNDQHRSQAGSLRRLFRADLYENALHSSSDLTAIA